MIPAISLCNTYLWTTLISRRTLETAFCIAGIAIRAASCCHTFFKNWERAKGKAGLLQMLNSGKHTKEPNLKRIPTSNQLWRTSPLLRRTSPFQLTPVSLPKTTVLPKITFHLKQVGGGLAYIQKIVSWQASPFRTFISSGWSRARAWKLWRHPLKCVIFHPQSHTISRSSKVWASSMRSLSTSSWTGKQAACFSAASLTFFPSQDLHGIKMQFMVAFSPIHKLLN